MSKVTSEQVFGPVSSALYDKLEIQQRIEQVENPYSVKPEPYLDSQEYRQHMKLYKAFEEARQLFKEVA